MEKSSHNLQSLFGGTETPDQLIGRLSQLLAERGVPPQKLITAILNDDTRGEAARCHAWYAARMTKTYSADFIESAIKNAQSFHGPSAKMALEFLEGLPLSAKAEINENRVKELLFELGRGARELPADAEINQVAISITAVNIAPKFADDSEVIPFLRDIVMGAKNNNVKISALDALILFPHKSISKELETISQNLATLFPDEGERLRAASRINRRTK